MLYVKCIIMYVYNYGITLIVILYIIKAVSTSSEKDLIMYTDCTGNDMIT